MHRGWTICGALNGLLAVAAGAFAAHGLQHLPERYLNAFRTAAEYEMYHALALLLVAVLPAGRAATAAGALFLAGIVLFSGSLYALALTRLNVLGAVTPLGGVLFLGGWLALAVHALRRR